MAFCLQNWNRLGDTKQVTRPKSLLSVALYKRVGVWNQGSDATSGRLEAVGTDRSLTFAVASCTMDSIVFE